MNENTEMQNSVSEALPEAPQEEESLSAYAKPDVSDAPCDIPLSSASGEEVTPAPVSAPPAQNQAPDPGNPPSGTAFERMVALERELSALKRDFAQKEAEMLRMNAEYDEFSALYPDMSLDSLPDSVWSDVAKGVPLAAAFALAERKALLVEKKAALCNSENKKRSAGSLCGTENNFLSPAEVRVMSPAEVRQNYQKIIKSMKNWH